MQKELEKATEAGDSETMDKMNRRLVKVTKEHSEECKELLDLMGIPYVDVSFYLTYFRYNGAVQFMTCHQSGFSAYLEIVYSQTCVTLCPIRLM